MDKIGRPDAEGLLSRQVTRAQYFFLNLAPRRGDRAALVLGGREHCNPDYRVARSTYPFFGLEYVRSGTGTVQLDGRRCTLRPGAVFTYGPATRCEIRTDPDDRLVKYFLCLRGPAAATRLRRLGLGPGAALHLSAHAEITSILEDIVREGQRSGDLASRICTTLFDLLLLKIEDTAKLVPRASDPSRQAFLRCKALIDAEAERLATLADIARAAGVEASSVCRWFRRYQGSSPYQYLLRRKMNLAAEHLVEQGGLVKEVAQRVGFADPYHFSRAFKAVHGVAPRALLRYRPA